MKDLRTREMNPIFRVQSTGANIQSVQYYDTNSTTASLYCPYMFLTHDGDFPAALMIDTRFSNRTLAQRNLPEAHSTVKIISHSNLSLSATASRATEANYSRNMLQDSGITLFRYQFVLIQFRLTNVC